MKKEDSPENIPNFNTETIKSLVILFYRNFFSYTPKQAVIAYNLCKTLANIFKEKEFLNRLEEIKNKNTTNCSLSLIQHVSFRDSMLGRSMNKQYNYHYGSKPLCLGDLIEAVDEAILEIMNIFTEICVKHDIDTSLISPEMFLNSQKATL